MAEPLVIPVAHDFNCGWCWVGLFQIKRLKEEFGVKFDWLGYELQAEDEPWPDSAPPIILPNKPTTLSRFQFLLKLEGMEMPKAERPRRMKTFNAHQAVEYLKSTGAEPDAFIEALYRAFWEKGMNINEIPVLRELVAGHIENVDEMAKAIEEGRFRDRTVKFDAPAYKSGVYNVPTFWIGGERYAEQPYQVLADALRNEKGIPKPGAGEVYSHLHFPPAPADRPYVYIDMVATIDGKIISGSRDEPVVDLGSEVDHQFMKRIEAASDAVMLGAQTLRSAKKTWNPQAQTRIVVTKSGHLDFDVSFFSGKPVVASTEEVEVPKNVELLRFNDLKGLLKTLRERGIEKLLVLGGSTLNAQLFEEKLIDEIFVTIAPKIKLGEDVPTMADGNALPRESIQNYSIVEQHQIGDELFVRYRRNP